MRRRQYIIFDGSKNRTMRLSNHKFRYSRQHSPSIRMPLQYYYFVLVASKISSPLDSIGISITGYEEI